MSIFDKFRSPDAGDRQELFRPGDDCGDYKIVRLISVSIIGVFYDAQHKDSGNRVSLMIMPSKTSTDARFGDRFRNLVERVKQLKHEAILPLLDGKIITRRYVLIYEAIDPDAITLEDYPEQLASGDIANSKHPFTLQGQREQDAKVTEREAPATGESGKPSKPEGPSAALAAREASGTKPPTASRIPFLSKNPLGISLTRQKSPTVPYQLAAPIFRQVLECMKYVHSEGMDHLSLTPSNILYYPDGSIRIFNIGLIHTLEKELFERIVSAGISPIQSGSRKIVLNSIDMFSPEIRGGQAYRANSDIYGIGVLCYWMLSGKKPSMGKYQSPRESAQDIPGNWDLFLYKSLDTDPKARYPTIASQLSDFIKINLPQRARGNNLLASQLERIPVPDRIRERGGRVALAWRLSILGGVGVIILGIFQLLIPRILPEEEIGGREVAFQALEDGMPNVQFSFDPERVKVEFLETDSRFLVLDGRLNLNVKKGSRPIRVSAPGHFPREFELDIKSTPLDPIRVTLSQKWAKLRVIGTPQTLVTGINSKGQEFEVGVIGEDGILLAEEKLLADTYTLVGERPNYRPNRLSGVELPFNDLREVEIFVEPLPGRVEVVSQPAGATVYVNGDSQGETPLVLEAMPVEKTLNMEVVKPGFREKAKSFRLDPNANLLLDFGNLVMKTGEIRPQVVVPSGSLPGELLEDLTYIVDGVSFPGTAQVLSPVMEGEHTLRVEHPDYFPTSVTVRVGDGRFTPVAIDLAPKPGQLTVRLDPPLNFELEANGTNLEPVNEAGTTFSFPPNQPFNLEIKIRNHLSAVKKISFDPNERELWTLKAVPIPGPTPGEDYLVPYVGVEMIFIEEGTFVMGSPPEEISRLPEEGPPTQMTLTRPYWIGKYEIQQSEYGYIMEENPSRFSGATNPVDSVSWNEANQFCQRLTAIERQAGRLPEGYEYRLPTEAEWEYAARAGTRTPFFWGSSANPDLGNFKGVYPRDFNEDQDISGIYGSVKGGQYNPNPWGLYDVHGNLREWTHDDWNARLPGGASIDYTGPEFGRQKSFRGGGWEDPAQLARSAVRNGLRPSTRSSSLGFRIVLGPQIK